MLERRIKSMLEDMLPDPENFAKHKSWGYYISTGLDELKRIGLILEESGEEYGLSVSCHFGDTMSQSRNFYENDRLTMGEIERLRDEGWGFEADFTVMHISQHIVEFDTPKDKEGYYLQYWPDHLDLLEQRDQDELISILKEFHNKGLITIDEAAEEKLQKEILKTNRQSNFNICPGIHLHYDFSPEEAVKLDDEGELERAIRNRIEEVVHAAGNESALEELNLL